MDFYLKNKILNFFAIGTTIYTLVYMLRNYSTKIKYNLYTRQKITKIEMLTFINTTI